MLAGSAGAGIVGDRRNRRGGQNAAAFIEETEEGDADVPEILGSDIEDEEVTVEERAVMIRIADRLLNWDVYRLARAGLPFRCIPICFHCGLWKLAIQAKEAADWAAEQLAALATKTKRGA